MVDPNSVLGQVFGWVTLASLVAIVGLLVNIFWEKRKLSRSERIKAYASFRSSYSRWTRLIGIVGRLAKEPDFSDDNEKVQKAVGEAKAARETTYDAYAQLEMVAPPKGLAAAYSLLTLNDSQFKAFFNKGKGVPADARAEALSNFTKISRRDLGLKRVSPSFLKSHKYKPLED